MVKYLIKSVVVFYYLLLLVMFSQQVQYAIETNSILESLVLLPLVIFLVILPYIKNYFRLVKK
ncbi:MAG: hypothetical protein NXI20_02745 [bacterium]|nr:hypothetical protein [bacterium]